MFNVGQAVDVACSVSGSGVLSQNNNVGILVKHEGSRVKEEDGGKGGGHLLSASQEDYLEAISNLAAEKGVARAKEIADLLGVQRASVTGALRTLRDNGMIHYTPYSNVTLTEQGRREAGKIVRRHQILQRFFREILNVNDTTAEEVACKVEHAVSGTVMENLTALMDFIEKSPRAGSAWLAEFHKALNERVANK